MGVIYKAEDTKLRRTVALKFLPPALLSSEDDRRRFFHEAQASASLSHPNIATVFEIDEAEGQSFIALEYIEGASLAEKVHAGPLKLEEAFGIAIQLAEGLHAAHEKGIVHRDVKSQNVMVTGKGQVKILDFGLAKLRGASVVTKTGTTLGTMGYMAPEQLRGEQMDSRADLWAVGVVLYEMIAGRTRFHGDYEEAIAYQILNARPDPLTAVRTGIPMDLEKIVAKLLQKDPAARYQHVDELLVDLRALKQGVGSESVHAAAPPPSVRSRRPWLLASMGVAMLAVVCIGVYWLLLRPVGSRPIKAIAVMPLKSLSPRQDQDYVTEGMEKRSYRRTFQDSFSGRPGEEFGSEIQELRQIDRGDRQRSRRRRPS